VPPAPPARVWSTDFAPEVGDPQRFRYPVGQPPWGPTRSLVGGGSAASASTATPGSARSTGLHLIPMPTTVC